MSRRFLKPKRSSTTAGIFTIPLEKSGITPVSQLVEILKKIFRSTILISGNEANNFFSKDALVSVCIVNHESGRNVLSRIWMYSQMQMKMGLCILKNINKVHTWFSIIGSNSLIIPSILVKVTNKKLIKIIAGSDSDVLKIQRDRFAFIIRLFTIITNKLADRIVLYSERFIRPWNLEKVIGKIVIAPRHFIRSEEYNTIIPFPVRKNTVGFIGRLSEEKGILNFLEAIKILPDFFECEFIIIGDGILKNIVLQFIESHKNNKKIQYLGWIPHSALNDHLNRLRLIVIPSYSEGLPNIMLESMAAGTPVLAARVGAIPDVIYNERTGFILGKNNPSELSDRIKTVLEKKNLQEVALNARLFIQKMFSFGSVVRRYKKLVLELGLY